MFFVFFFAVLKKRETGKKKRAKFVLFSVLKSQKNKETHKIISAAIDAML